MNTAKCRQRPEPRVQTYCWPAPFSCMPSIAFSGTYMAVSLLKNRLPSSRPGHLNVVAAGLLGTVVGFQVRAHYMLPNDCAHCVQYFPQYCDLWFSPPTPLRRWCTLAPGPATTAGLQLRIGLPTCDPWRERRRPTAATRRPTDIRRAATVGGTVEDASGL